VTEPSWIVEVCAKLSALRTLTPEQGQEALGPPVLA